MKTASICTIGDEILIGQIVDTNSSHIARELNLLGIQVKYMTSIGDDHQRIVSELGNCLDLTDIVIVTGGLGPTKDDITKEALRELSASSGYKESAEQMAHIQRILGARGIPMLENNRAQALVPDACTVIPNKLGTAPCMAFYGLGETGKSALYSLPGVPFEAIGLLPDVMGSGILPWKRSRTIPSSPSASPSPPWPNRSKHGKTRSRRTSTWPICPIPPSASACG